MEMDTAVCLRGKPQKTDLAVLRIPVETDAGIGKYMGVGADRYFFHVFGDRSSRIGKNSSLPASISKVNTSLESGEKKA